jgi:hypothetical protein
MKKFSIGLSLVGLAMLNLPLALSADQDEMRAALTDVWYMMPKQGMQTQFETAVKTHMAFRSDAGDSREWEGYSVALGSNPGLYQWRYCCFDWADQDSYVAEDQENGYSANWIANVDQYVDHYHHYIERMDWETSNWPEDMGQDAYYGVTTWSLKTGAGPGPEEARKQLSQIAMDKGWAEAGNMWLWHERIGGQPRLMIVSPYKNFADMKPPEQSFFEFVSKTVGSAEEAGKMFDQFTAGLTGSDYTLWAYRPDLSASSTSGSDDD